MKVETVTEQLLFATVRIEIVTPNGSASGTGSIFSYRHADKEFLFIVTNKHVIANSFSGQFFFTLSDDAGTKPLIGQRYTVTSDNFQSLWYGHSDPAIDVTISPLVPILQQLEKIGKRPFFRSIPHTSILGQEEIEELDPLEEIIFIGYPNGLYDTVNLLPIIRRGTTATPPQLDYCGRPTFLIDASVFGGSSGSPVFLYSRSGYTDRRGNTNFTGPRINFLGVVAEVHIREDYNPLQTLIIPTNQMHFIKSTQNLDLGIVFKSNVIVDVVKDFLVKNGQLTP